MLIEQCRVIISADSTGAAEGKIFSRIRPVQFPEFSEELELIIAIDEKQSSMNMDDLERDKRYSKTMEDITHQDQARIYQQIQRESAQKAQLKDVDPRLKKFMSMTNINDASMAQKALIKHNWDESAAINEYFQKGNIMAMITKIEICVKLPDHCPDQSVNFSLHGDETYWDIYTQVSDLYGQSLGTNFKFVLHGNDVLMDNFSTSLEEAGIHTGSELEVKML